MQNRFKACLFDMDGTMFDTEKLTYHTVRKALSDIGKKDLAVHYLKLIGRTDQEIVEDMIRWFRLDTDEEKEEFKKLFLFYHEKITIKDNFCIKPGLEILLTHLHARGIKWGIVSSSSKTAVEQYCRWADLPYGPDIIISGDDINEGKPNPEPFLFAASKLGVLPGECLIIEDSPLGIEAAWRAGIPSIMIPDLVKSGPLEERRSLAVLDSLEEVVSFL